jgi:hypothetical protein
VRHQIGQQALVELPATLPALDSLAISH